MIKGFIFFFCSTCAIAMPTSLPAEASSPCARIVALEAFQSTEETLDGAICTTYQNQSLSTATSCHWAFPYRDTSAKQLAASLWTELQSCRLGEEQPPDQAVNHPDSYVLQVWSAKDAVYRLSIKDKAGLDRTFAFLSYERR